MTRHKDILKEVKLYVAKMDLSKVKKPLLYILLDTELKKYVVDMHIRTLDEVSDMMAIFSVHYRIPKKVAMTLHTFSDSEHTLPPILPINEDEFHHLEKILEENKKFNIHENEYSIDKEMPKGEKLYLYRGWQNS